MSRYIYTSPLPAVDVPDMHITDYVTRCCAKHPERLAFINGLTGEGLTFSTLITRTKRLAGGLRSHGFLDNDVLALIAPNCADYAVVLHATALCGGTFTPVNSGFGIAELRCQLLDSKAIWVVADKACMAVARQAIRGTHVTTLICLQDRCNGLSISDLLGRQADQVVKDRNTHPVILPYSSGTTGFPKGVMLSHRNLVANMVQLTATLQHEENETALAVLPFFHIFGMQVMMGCFLSEGHTIVTLPRFEIKQALIAIEKYKVTQFFVVPPIVLSLARSPTVDEHDLSSLRKVFCGAAPLGAKLSQEVSQRLGCAVVQGYGMTELSPASHITPGYHGKPGASGVTVPNTRSRIIDESGNDLPPNITGQLLVKGPQVMIGYLDNNKATRDTVDKDGWLHTGDLAMIDDEGYLIITDRVKELIKYKGFQVAPAELEALLITHPDVADAAVVGIPDEEAGELPKAFLVFAGDASVIDKQAMNAKTLNIRQFVTDHLARYKAIHQVQWIDVIPKSASGKILRSQLREEMTEQVE
ncbi:AMP-binding protein [Granulosicoccus sp.]|nr:AMP-binding protein [Granulosicoccus sp.]